MCARYVHDGDEDLESKLRRDVTSIAPIDSGELRDFRVDALVARAFIKF